MHARYVLSHRLLRNHHDQLSALAGLFKRGHDEWPSALSGRKSRFECKQSRFECKQGNFAGEARSPGRRTLGAEADGSVGRGAGGSGSTGRALFRCENRGLNSNNRSLNSNLDFRLHMGFASPRPLRADRPDGQWRPIEGFCSGAPRPETTRARRAAASGGALPMRRSLTPKALPQRGELRDHQSNSSPRAFVTSRGGPRAAALARAARRCRTRAARQSLGLKIRAR